MYIWTGILTFGIFSTIATIVYFQVERFDSHYKKNTDLIRGIKLNRFNQLLRKHYASEVGIEDESDSKSAELTIDRFHELEAQMFGTARNLEKLTLRAADLRMWYDYIPKGKEFLTRASLWLFLEGAILLFLFLYAAFELNLYDAIRIAPYLTFLPLLAAMKIWQNILRHNTVRTNINKQMDLFREGNLETF